MAGGQMGERCAPVAGVDGESGKVTKSQQDDPSRDAPPKARLESAASRLNIAMALRDVALRHGGLDDLVVPTRDDTARVVIFEDSRTD